MKFVEYARRRRMGYSVTESMRFSQDSDSGDKAVAVGIILFFVWIFADSLSAIL